MGRKQTQETRDKIRASLKGRHVGSAIERVPLLTKCCPQCSIEFSTKNIKQMWCSRKCANKGKKKPSGGLRLRSGRGKSGWYKGIYCSSRWELAYLIFCLDKQKNISRYSGWFTYYDPKDQSEHRYYPDFLVDGKIIEIKGYKTYRDELKKSSGPVTFLYKEDLLEIFNYVEKLINLKISKIDQLYESGSP